MKTNILILLMLFICFENKSQVVPDSLKGIYIGQFWYANPNTSPWVITLDTVYVTDVDTINCNITTNSSNGYFIGMPDMYTVYNYCNTSPPVNLLTLFYNMDSLKMIYDDLPQPPPNPNSISQRFYGKRIPGTSNVGIKEESGKENIKIFPNPAKNEIELYIPEKKGFGYLTIYNINGQTVKTLEIQNLDFNMPIFINIGKLSEGLYLLNISINNEIYQTKFKKEK
jgi:hypothetical protein